MDSSFQSFPSDRLSGNEANSSGVSWAAIIGGAFGSAALSLIMLSLGAGLGLSTVSPWSNKGASSTAITGGAIAWLIVTQILSASMGGYLAGRLRTKWTGIHNDEVYFRDTAHGFFSWAVALVITAAFLTSAATTMVGSASTGAEEMSSSHGAHDYFVDTLFRSEGAKTDSGNEAALGEAGSIFAKGLREGSLSASDKHYIGQMVTARTGLSAGDADQRVADVFTVDQQAMENARKTLAHTLLWLFLAILIGAFCSSFAATLGGRQRDHIRAV